MLNKIIMYFTLNGNKKEYIGDPELPLLTYLREYEGIISPKDGCAPQAACGCCVVELNGKAKLNYTDGQGFKFTDESKRKLNQAWLKG